MLCYGHLGICMAAPLGGAPCAVRASCEKYATLWKATVAVDHWINDVWVCPVLPGTSADVKIWDKYGPQCTKECFMEFEVGIHDGACKVWLYRGGGISGGSRES